MKQTKYLAAKVNIHGNIFSRNVDELIDIHIPNAILSYPEIYFRKWSWGFTNLQKIQVNNEEIIKGNLTKYTVNPKETVKDGNKVKVITSPLTIARTAFFVYHIKKEIVVFENTSEITPENFTKMFAKLISKHECIGEIIVNFIPEEKVIENELKKIETLTYLKFSIIHPNRSREDFDLYQKVIEENKSKKVELTMRNSEGLNIMKEIDNEEEGKGQFNDVVQDGIKLINKGYGDVKASGFKKIVVHGKGKKGKIKKQNQKFSSNNSITNMETAETDENKLITKMVSFIINIKM